MKGREFKDVLVSAAKMAISATSSRPTRDGDGTAPSMESCKDVLLTFFIKTYYQCQKNDVE